MPKLPIGDMGPVELIWDYGTDSGQANLNMSPFLGKITVKKEDTMNKVHEEKWGDSPVDAVFGGGPTEMEIPLTRQTLAQLNEVLPGVSLSGSVLTFSAKCGSTLYDLAKPICIKPVRDGVVSTTATEWMIVYKVGIYRAFEIPFDRSTQRVIVAKAIVFPNQESGYEGEEFQMGTT